MKTNKNEILGTLYSFIVLGILSFGLSLVFPACTTSNNNSSQSSSSSYSTSSYNSSQKASESDNKNYKELLRAGEEFEKACDKYNRELNMIADKATSSAYSGVYAQKIFWDCDDAFQLVEKKGAAFARAMRKCGQEDNARELERRLKADRRKYNSYKDEVNHMLGIY